MENEEKVLLLKLEAKIHDLEKRLDSIQTMLKNSPSKSAFSNGNIWVLVPVAAIIMWGLQKIF